MASELFIAFCFKSEKLTQDGTIVSLRLESPPLQIFGTIILEKWSQGVKLPFARSLTHWFSHRIKGFFRYGRNSWAKIYNVKSFHSFYNEFSPLQQCTGKETITTNESLWRPPTSRVWQIFAHLSQLKRTRPVLGEKDQNLRDANSALS